MKKCIVTLRNPADQNTFTRTYKVRGNMVASHVKIMALREHPRCIIIKLTMVR